MSSGFSRPHIFRFCFDINSNTKFNDVAKKKSRPEEYSELCQTSKMECFAKALFSQNASF